MSIYNYRSLWRKVNSLQDGNGSASSEAVIKATSGYEFTGGFSDRETGNAATDDIGTYIDYTQSMVDNDQWYRFGFDETSQLNNDVAYWSDPDPDADPDFDQTKGLFGGLYMPPGFSEMIDFDFSEPSGYSAGALGEDLNYTAADGSFNFGSALPGDFAEVRFDFQVRPQVANTTLEIAMIWETRDSNGNPTYIFPLTGTPIFFGTGTVGKTFLNRPILTAYFASQEDVKAKALLAIKSDNPVEIAPLTTLVRIAR